MPITWQLQKPDVKLCEPISCEIKQLRSNQIVFDFRRKRAMRRAT